MTSYHFSKISKHTETRVQGAEHSELGSLQKLATQTQQIAADPRLNVWVSASAGTGKTKILTDRVLNLLLNGAHPSRLLCITFTKAAAAEMYKRLSDRLSNWATMTSDFLAADILETLGYHPSPDQVNLAKSLLLRVLESPGGLKIQTIHSFCQSVLMRFPLEAGISPGIKVLDELSASELKQKALIETLEDSLISLSQAIEILSNSLSFKKVCEILESHPPVKIPPQAHFQEFHLKPHLDISDPSLLQKCAQILLKGKKTDQDRGQIILEFLNHDLPTREKKFLLYIDAYLTKEHDIRKRLVTIDLIRAHPSLENTLLQEAERLKEMLIQQKEIMTRNISLAFTMVSLKCQKTYEALKQKQGVLDFDDLIRHTASLFSKFQITPWVLYKLDGGIDHILVDEAQDTNAEQWQIISALVEEFFHNAQNTSLPLPRTIFIVGDTKQSIYSFQGANPFKFQEIEAHFSQLAAQTQNSWKRIDLEVTFRSAPAILSLVDESLKNPLVKEATQFGKTCPPHRAFRHRAGGCVELWPLIPAEEKEDSIAWEAAKENTEKRLDPATTCARLISTEISSWLQTQKKLLTRGRPIQPRDILILVQRRGKFVDTLIKELKRQNVPVSGSDRMILTDQLVVRDLLALADFLLFPDDDLTLAIVLKSSFLGFTEEDLLTLCPHRKGTLWSELKKRADETPRFQQACTLLRSLLRNLDYLRPYELYSQLLITYRGKEKILSRLGRECQDALEEFLNLTLQFEKSQVPSLQNFVHWIRSGQSEIKRDMDETTQNKVRIMTVHGAKGLQAPIVILPDTTRIPRLQESILPFEDAHYQWVPPLHLDTATTKTLKTLHEKKQMAEYYRLYYVALTRAEDQLIVCGWENARTQHQLTWYELIHQSLLTLKAISIPETHRLVLEHSCQPSKDMFSPSETFSPLPLPDFMSQNIPIPSLPLSPLNPSKLRDSEKHILIGKPDLRTLSPDVRGTLIHRLLEVLPQIPSSQWVEMGSKHIDRAFRDHTKNDFIISAGVLQEQENILTETLQSLKKIQALTSGCQGIYRELPVEGIFDERPLSAVIDLLVDYTDHALIIDYKTNFSPPPFPHEISPSYLKQISLYREITEKMLSKPVICGILWTSNGVWMEIPLKNQQEFIRAG